MLDNIKCGGQQGHASKDHGLEDYLQVRDYPLHFEMFYNCLPLIDQMIFIDLTLVEIDGQEKEIQDYGANKGEDIVEDKELGLELDGYGKFTIF